MGVLIDEWMDGWLWVSKAVVRNCLVQSKNTFSMRNIFFALQDLAFLVIT
jgi:hypothetical protein